MKKTPSTTWRILWQTSWTKTDDDVLDFEVRDVLDSEEDARKVFQVRQVWSVGPAVPDEGGTSGSKTS